MPTRPRPPVAAIDRQLLADPAIKAAIDAQQLSLWQQTIEQVRDSRTLPSHPEPATLPWGSHFLAAVDPNNGDIHASSNRTVTECNQSCSPLALGNGVVGPGGTWLKPTCRVCLDAVELWEAHHA